MKSRVDDPDAEGPKDAPELPFGVPAVRQAADFSRSLDDVFGKPPVDADEPISPDASRDTLAELFGRPPGADSEIHWAPSDVEASPEVVLRAVSPEAGDEPGGSRGVRRTLFGSRARTAVSVTASVVLVAAIVGGAAYAVQTVSAQNRLLEAQASLEASESAIDGPAALLETAFADYDATKLDARAAADGAGPSLAAVAGDTETDPLDAANAALAELVAALDADVPPPAPAPYERSDVGSDPDEVTAAVQSARDYADEVRAGIRQVQTLTFGLKARMTALTAALNDLGESLPATAAGLAAQNPLAEQSFRDAVVAAAAAVVAAQAAGESGDVALLAYAAAVAALREDQARAVAEEEVAPPSGAKTPDTGTPTPTPATPEPKPTTPTTPIPPPEPTDPPLPDP